MKTTRVAPIGYIFPQWFSAPVLPYVLANEIRAVFPVWIFACAALGISFVAGPGFANMAAFMAYSIGCAAIGAIAAGHDFTHRTASFTLAQPIARIQIWRYRFWIGAVAMGILAILAALNLNIPRAYRFGGPAILFVLVDWMAPLLYGLFLAPWLTLACRSTLAGMVFTLCIPYGLSFGLNMLTQSESVQRLFYSGMLLRLLVLSAVCAAGAFLGQRAFLRLELADSPAGGHFKRRDGSRATTQTFAAAKRSNRFLALLAKELRLQVLALVPAAALILTMWSAQTQPARPDTLSVLHIMVLLWAALICILIGAVASAEERQLGTVEGQMLLPVPKWNQWGVKIFTVTTLALVLAVLVPWVVLRTSPAGNQVLERIAPPGSFVLPAVLLVACSLYISSLCRSSLRAILAALPASAVVLSLSVLLQRSYDALAEYFGERHGNFLLSSVAAETAPFSSIQELQRESGPDTSWAAEPIGWTSLYDFMAMSAPILFTSIFLYLLFRFALENHSSAEIRPRRIISQISWLLAFKLGSFLLSAALLLLAL